MTFTELKTDVYEIAQAKFGQLKPEVVQRLDVELNAIEKHITYTNSHTLNYIIQ